MNLFAVGYNNITNESFVLDNVRSDVIVDLLELTELGMDDIADAVIEKVSDGDKSKLAKVLDSFLWIDFGDEAKRLVQSGERFAIKTNEVVFGIAGDYDNAKIALDHEEF